MGPRTEDPEMDRGGFPMGRIFETFIASEKRGKREIVPELELKEGDIINDWFSGKTPVEAEVVEVDAPHKLVFKSKRGDTDVSWAIVTKRQEDGTTRLQTRLRVGPVKHKKVVQAVGGAIDRFFISELRNGINERIAGAPEPSEKGLKSLKVATVVGAAALAYAAGRKIRKSKEERK